MIRRLRAKGQPIRLFGEADRDRRLRLRALELIEEKEHERHGGQNDFKKALEDVESGAQKELDEKSRKKEGREGKDGGVEILDLNLVKTDPDKPLSAEKGVLTNFSPLQVNPEGLNRL